MRRIYISGPITGQESEAEKAFKNAEEVLRGLGYFPINPEKCLRSTDYDHDDYMPINLAMLKPCHGILMLPGWRESVGACAEWGMALALGKDVMFLEDDRIKGKERSS